MSRPINNIGQESLEIKTKNTKSKLDEQLLEKRDLNELWEDLKKLKIPENKKEALAILKIFGSTNPGDYKELSRFYHPDTNGDNETAKKIIQYISPIRDIYKD